MGKHSLTIEGDDLADLKEAVAAFHGTLNGETEATTVPSVRVKAGRKAKPAAAEEEFEAEAEVEEATEEEEETADTLDDVKVALKELAKKTDVDTAQKVLKKFKTEDDEPVKKTAELKEEDYAAVIKACKKAVAA